MNLFANFIAVVGVALLIGAAPTFAAGGKVAMTAENSGSFDGVVHNSQGYTSGVTDGTTVLQFKGGPTIKLYGHCAYYFSPSIGADVEGWCRSKTQTHTDSIEMVFTCTNKSMPAPTTPIPDRDCTGTIVGGTGLFQNASGTLDWKVTTVDWTLDWSRTTSKGKGNITY